MHLLHKHENQNLDASSQVKVRVSLIPCMPLQDFGVGYGGGQRQQDPWGFLAASLAEKANSGFRERPCLEEIKRGRQKRTHDTLLGPVESMFLYTMHITSHTHTYTDPPTHRKKHEGREQGRKEGIY